MFSIHFDVTIHPDRVRITNCKTGQTIDRSSDEPFSSPGLLIAEPSVAANFFKKVIIESDGRPWYRRLWATASISFAGASVSQIERDAVRTLFEQMGASDIRFV